MNSRIGVPQRPALLTNGTSFGLHGLGNLGDYAQDANGNVIMDASGNPVAATDYAGIGQALVAGLAVLNSQQVFQLNLSRANQGLPPITLPGTTSLLNTSSNSLMLMGAGLIALMLFLKKR